MFDGVHCPKCAKRVKKRYARSVSCRCGWSYYLLPESNLKKKFLVRRYKNVIHGL